MSKVTDLKDALVDHLVHEIENPGELGVPGNVLSTAAKVVKDFAHEIEDEEGAEAAAIKTKQLANYLNKTRPSGHA